MEKLYTDYSLKEARRVVSTTFSMHPTFIEQTSKMSACYLFPLAALCQGKTLTTTGNSIDANYKITRASAVIRHLRKFYAIPIQRRIIMTTTRTGGNAKQALFYISKEDLSELEANPEAVFRRQLLKMKADTNAQALKKLHNLVQELGYNWVRNQLEAMVKMHDG